MQPPGCFVELLAIAQPDQIIARAPQVFSFGAFSREFLARAEGLSMLALESRNASEDAESFCAAGFGRHTGFFVCQQHQPQNLWDRALQVRPNGVSTIAGAVLVAENPADHHIFLSMLAGERNLRVTSAGTTVPPPRGALEVMTPETFSIGFGVKPPDLSHGTQGPARRARRGRTWRHVFERETGGG